MMCGTDKNRVLEWRASAAVCQHGTKNRFLAQVLGFLGGMACWTYRNTVRTEVKLRYYYEI